MHQEHISTPPTTVAEFDALLDSVINDPSTSFWLRQALESMLRRDPEDFLSDNKVLLTIAAQRAGLIREEARRILAKHGS